MKFSNRSKYLLFGLLTLLNILIRIPSTPHERGSPDEFTMHALANSLAMFGEARWWVHPTSIFGFYPYSYASSSPFIFSGISQCTGVSLEWIAWIFCALLGIFVMFSAYLMAGQIKNDDLFKFLVAFIASLSLATLNYLTWQISARGFLVALLPFFLYVLLKSRVFPIRVGALTFIAFILLMATHHLYILTVPIIFGFIVLTILYKLKGRITKFIKCPDVLISFALLAGLFGMFAIPFFTNLFIHGSRYGELHLMLENNIRYSGPLLLLALGGLSYLILKRDRVFGEWFILLSVILWAPFLYIERYTQFIFAILISLLICIALVNIAKAYKGNRKQVLSVIILILLLYVSFSGFYQHWRTNIGEGKQVTTWYIADATYNSGLWIRDNINENKRMVGKNDHITTSILAISKVPTLAIQESDITYGFVNVSNIGIRRNSPLSVEFYMDRPYAHPRIYPETVSDRWYLGLLDIDSVAAKRIINKYNLSYYIEDIYFRDIFSKSLRKERIPAYDNGRIRIWCLDKT